MQPETRGEPPTTTALVVIFTITGKPEKHQEDIQREERRERIKGSLEFSTREKRFKMNKSNQRLASWLIRPFLYFPQC
jgi:hypothetical protein